MNRIKSVILSSAFTATTLVGGLAGQAYAAGNASLSMSGGSHQAGTSFAVPIFVNSGSDPVNVVQADWSYDASKLQFQGVSCGGSFGITAGSGANTVTCGVANGASVSGSQLVAVANFKALAGSGSSVISIASSSHVWRSTDNADIWNGVPTSTGISFTGAAAVRSTTPLVSQPTTTTTTTPTPTPAVKKAATKVAKPATTTVSPAAITAAIPGHT